MTKTEDTAPTGYVWGYRRVSSVQQSYDRQTKALQDAGIPEERIYEDKLSGKLTSRPGLDALLKVARPGDLIHVSSLDRLGRTVLGTLQTIEELEGRGIHVRSLKEGESFEGVTGRLIRNVMLSLAEWERENTAERAADARAARADKGIKTVRTPTKVTTANIAAVKALRKQGLTIKAIAENQEMSRASVYRALAE